MLTYPPGMLDILARAYDRALDALPSDGDLDTQTARAALLRSLLDAARSGERDEVALAVAALNKMAQVGSADSDDVEAAGRMPIGL